MCGFPVVITDVHFTQKSSCNSRTPAVMKERIVDLRSDTVTRPSSEMMHAMMAAPVGDDVWGDDPTINQLQQEAAALFGKEAALFCPSGTMTNQIAIKCHTSPGEECVCSDTAHIFLYEGGGMAFNSAVQARIISGDRGRITASQIASAINAEDAHFPTTGLVCIENTTNKGGGAFYSADSLREISELCRTRGLPLHLDGARIFNAIVASQEYSTYDIGAMFDTISVCLSKGLGCPVGSLLLGSHQFIKKAHRIRKVMGGGMRQAGFLAAAGLYALKYNVERLAEDHSRAKQLGTALSDFPWVQKVYPVDTNIVIFTLQPQYDALSVQEQLKSSGLLISSMGGGVLRLVTHLDVNQEAVDWACSLLQELKI
ncbi:hypothetical protein CEUSTIGMA_g3423.t1 [Chlamydomonas eustigma]|uniref:Aromatic amino acid beta-eliminating lyase/threonine aldolase domain-containing protein n=1 Tax=Chlamydomonas eustigma TaxID=1157962 RepID=A0A250WZP6_9CHLO|nr:hypothetical protein CEUSTIGMA_g3423.t1 [Chlamydomonas eustigma]|eukprot:GAX75980.1 hypothetical protein CEUSTIGMA_g3423.t1 [Chlamydomonas eustigma]